ncbi:recombinase family protein [Bacillus mycoides]|uniref:recombinase family protein n=1 Tax=Bacillus mycoides TaxID=1405 RepID=UPI001F29B0EC|nr:recombinase family protein [Bacillus mycoides]
MITVLSGIVEFEADMIKERQLEALKKRRKEGAIKEDPRSTQRITETYSMLLNYFATEQVIN